ncbi:MAG: penicillin-binding protein 2 [Candidatus Pacebacteria bacterium]|jgi:cell division protein FtsI/penicillin-binding protein 2|nr:penicillin-binding protein 2 [Candidatus Paceibacterota bacterium]MBT3512309.1 penicillin-binding protein 2 [Candidatus Paceibacterota bacterium]MBT4004834.1 penicillin-binding protein 2 [Candidatus Paceibacterota bacterium]MBT4358459.1 penicillin-binding protein 2 [Candidatus Paceibacterota bacterium]MBT4681114.1 penicillin-binding protein 2 [Candidatus Paceibacterota bacterium]
MISKYSRSRSKSLPVSNRNKAAILIIYFGLLSILVKLFYWQVIQGSWLKTAANNQYQRTLTQQGKRGQIFTSDKHLLVGNISKYRLVAYPQLLTEDPVKISKLINPIIIDDYQPYQESTESAKREELMDELEEALEQKLNRKEAKWVSLLNNLAEETKSEIEALNITGLDFEDALVRFYPEASMAAHLTGFVAKDEAGQDVGYFGVEGALNKELSGKKRRITLTADALGFSLLGQKKPPLNSNQGRDVVLTIRRDLQSLIETELKKGMEHYGAKSGEVLILQPQTGKILALAAEPKFDQEKYYQYDPYLYKNPLLIDLFEPGSIMKTLTVAIGIDTESITSETECPRCDGPVAIGKYSIKTWNDEYHPKIKMSDALAKSDNTAMVFVAEEVGSDVFEKYLQNFDIGEELGVDLYGDSDTPFPQKWGPIELATRSFGQGISTTSLQIAKAVSAIANHGQLMQIRAIDSVINPDGKEISVEPRKIRQVISDKAAQQTTEMMVHAAQSGEAQWIYSKTHTVAAKTGTSQIPAEDGGYKENATIATFIGFAPPENPQFLMLVKLVEPQSSPWAAETAAPLWYKIAEKLFLSLNIPPDHQESIGYN